MAELNEAESTEDAKKTKKEKKMEEKAAKKAAKKAKKNHEADKPDAENDDSDSVSSKIVMVLVTILIIAIWLGIFAVFVKADVGGFGSTVLAPALKDVPVLSKILPDSGNITASESTETAGYTNLDDAVSRIKELEKQLDDANSKNQADAQTINDLNAQIQDLSTYKEDQAAFEEEKEKYYEEVVFSDKAPDIKDDVPAFQESDIMLAATFLKDYAQRSNKPLVIISGVGSGSGSRTGATPLADVFDAYTKLTNTCVVVPAGNEAVSRTHFSGYAGIAADSKTMEINVDKRGKGFVIEIWAKSLDVLSVSIVSPTGEIIPRIPARIGVSSEYAFLLENSRIYVDYQITESVAGQEIIFMRFESPAEGVWKVLVYSLTSLPGYFNAWITPRFLSASDAYFLESDIDITLVEPACAARVITVGAYNHNTGGSDINSSRGYTADSRVKPDIVAPGVDVYGVGGVKGYKRMSGTSIAAAHAAGAAALFLSWGVTNKNREVIGNTEIKSYLIRGAKRRNSEQYPNVTAGYGMLDISGAFDQMRIN